MKLTSSREPIPFTFTPPSPFAIPAGCYRAVVGDVHVAESEIDESKLVLRIVFDVMAGENGPVKHAAALEYPEGKEGHAKLNEDFAAFFPQDEIDQMLGMPQEVDLSSLVGGEVDLMVSTFTGSDHPPYSRVTGIFSAGSFVTGTMLSMGKRIM